MSTIDYHWNLEKLRMQIKQAEELLKNPTISGRSKKTLQKEIKAWKHDIIMFLVPNKSKNILDDNDQEYEYHFTNFHVSKNVQDLFFGASPILLNKKIITDSEVSSWDKKEEESFYYNNHVLVSLVSDFYQDYFGIDIKPFILSSNMESFLHFKHITSYEEVYGVTGVNPCDNHNYGFVYRHGTINDVITTAHEVCHMMQMGKSRYEWKKPSILFTEATPLFIEMVVLDYLENKLGLAKEILDLWREIPLQEAIENINYLNLKKVALEELSLSPIVGEVEIKNRLRRNYPTVDDMDSFIRDHLYVIDEDEEVSMFQHNLSYYSANDLYHEFISDRERAIYHFQRYPYVMGNSISFLLDSLGCTFHRDGYSNLDKKVKSYQKK